MTAEKVLIIEDDPTLLRVLRDNFMYEGYVVLTAGDGEAGLETALGKRPDLILLDLMLPKINGYEICRLLRKESIDAPIIMLTAKGQESDIILGLNLGADDYVTKPFRMKVLLARANAFLRRRREPVSDKFTFGGFELDIAARTLRRGGREIELTPKEFSLLAHLARKAGNALSRDEILRSVWGYDVLVTGRSVDRCINTLRGKIEADPKRPRHIRTIREVGYRFVAENDE